MKNCSIFVAQRLPKGQLSLSNALGIFYVHTANILRQLTPCLCCNDIDSPSLREVFAAGSGLPFLLFQPYNILNSFKMQRTNEVSLMGIGVSSSNCCADKKGEIPQEIWKSIAFVEGYEVSNMGQVRYPERRVWAYNGHQYCLRLIKEHLLKQQTDKHGYKRIVLRRRGYFIHRLVAQAFICNPHHKEAVNHINGNKKDNRVENLEWCTNAENSAHAARIGLAYPIWECPNRYSQRKLNVAQISEIIAKYGNKKETKCTYASIANEYCVHKDTIGLIIRRQKSYAGEGGLK